MSATTLGSRADILAASEGRVSLRVLVDLEVDYQCEDNFLFAYVTDISDTGMFIKTTLPEAPGTHLNLRFTPDLGELLGSGGLAEAAPIEVEGEVSWVNPYRPGNVDSINPGMGVRFIALDDERRGQVLALVQRIAYL